MDIWSAIIAVLLIGLAILLMLCLWYYIQRFMKSSEPIQNHYDEITETHEHSSLRTPESNIQRPSTPSDRSSTYRNKPPIHLNKPLTQRNTSSPHRDRSSPHRERSPHRDRSSPHRDRSSPHRDRSSPYSDNLSIESDQPCTSNNRYSRHGYRTMTQDMYDQIPIPDTIPSISGLDTRELFRPFNKSQDGYFTFYGNIDFPTPQTTRRNTSLPNSNTFPIIYGTSNLRIGIDDNFNRHLDDFNQNTEPFAVPSSTPFHNNTSISIPRIHLDIPELNHPSVIIPTAPPLELSNTEENNDIPPPSYEEACKSIP